VQPEVTYYMRVTCTIDGLFTEDGHEVSLIDLVMNRVYIETPGLKEAPRHLKFDGSGEGNFGYQDQDWSGCSAGGSDRVYTKKFLDRL